MTHDVKQIKLNATRNPQMVFRMLQNGARKDLTAFDTATPNAQTGQKEIWDNYMGAPGVYLVWSVPQDGIDAPTDFNASASLYLKDVWRGAAAGSLTGPDADRAGYDYTIQALTGVMSMGGEPDGPPTMTGESVADLASGLFASWAALAAPTGRPARRPRRACARRTTPTARS